MRPAQRLKIVTNILAVLFLSFLLAYAFVLIPFGVFESAQLKTVDIFFRVSHALKPLPKQLNSVAIVAIDDASLQQVNRKWPWDRDVYAEMLKNIRSAQPRVIGFDIIFIGESAHKENDELFRRVIADAGNVVLASYYTDIGEHVIPHAPFADAARSYGLINKPRDMDYRVRCTRFFVEPEKEETKRIDYSFEAKILCEYYGCPVNDMRYDGRSIHIRNKRAGGPDIAIPVASDGIFTINYVATDRDFTVIPAWRIISGVFDKEELRDRIVLIGQTNEIIHDVYPTPLLDMPGVLINANAILTVLTGRYVTELPPLVNSLVLVLFTALAIGLTYRYAPLKGFFCIFLEIAVFLGLSAWAFSSCYVADFFSVIFCVVLSYIAVTFYKYVCLIIESVNLKQDAITDGLTGLFILKYFTLRIQNEFERAKRYNTKLSFIMMDIDHFKHFNDTYGHEQGNVVLKGFADLMKDTFRKSDIVARYGGEEFCALLPGVGRGEAFESAERFRRKLQSLPFLVRGQEVRVTVSIGVVSFPDTYIDATNDFIECADKALYEAKNSGRNKTVYYTKK